MPNRALDRPLDRPHPAGTRICTHCRCIRPLGEYQGFHGGPETKWCLTCRCKRRRWKKGSAGRVVAKKHRKVWLTGFGGWVYRSWHHLRLRTGYLGSAATQQIPQIRRYIERGVTLGLTKDEFYAFCSENRAEWEALRSAGKKPSIDRIDPSQGYRLGNLRILDNVVNMAMGASHSAIANNPKRKKSA